MKVLLLFIFISNIIFSQISISGSINGNVIDYETRQPLAGVTVAITNSKSGTTTDQDGNFEIKKVPVGSYTMAFSFIGYEKQTRTDVIVRSKRISFVNVELKPSAIVTENVVVSSGYFTQSERQPLSAVSFDFEEIRRAPGAGGDVSRIIFGLPSLAKINDTKNSLIVRGGSPVENGFFVDNIEIPNINHFPVQGSTEGPIGIINMDFVDNVNFYSGGFSSNYGDRLSSIMELNFREGNKIENDIQLDMSLQGFGGVIEGPISNGKGTYLFSARRSYLDLILDLMGEKVGLPIYSDYQGKVTYDLSPNHKLSVLNIFSYDRQKMNQKDAAENKNNIYNDYKYYTNTGGINWQFLWGKKGYSNTSFAHTFAKTDADFFQTRIDRLLFNNNTLEQEFKIRNANHYIINEQNKIDFGFDAKYITNDYKQFYNEYQDAFGKTTPSLTVNKNINTYKAGAFLNYTWNPVPNITFTPGVRADYYEFNKEMKISPRVSLTYHFSEKTSLTGTYGIFYQNIPWVLAAQEDKFIKLKNPRSDHYILGLNHLLTESTKFTLELYNKDYRDLPLDPTQPGLFIFDQAVIENVFLNHKDLISSGKANSKGVELTIQKKLAVDFYGLAAVSYYRAKYTGLNGTEYNRVYDNRFNFAIEGGYKPNEKWEFSLRWLYAGGAPYTPFDVTASTQSFKGIFDSTKVNSARLPDFHSLNIRADRRFYFKGSTLIVYLSIWNAYARKNIAAYTWDEIDNKISEEKMWGILPIFGIEYEF